MAKILEPLKENLKLAAIQLEINNIVAVPTETVYGLAGNAYSDTAIKKIFECKGRSDKNPLISHYLSLQAACGDIETNGHAERLADKFWPGPLTMVLLRRKGCRISNLACAGLPTAAIRVPAHKVMRAILENTGLPLAAPSANPSGRLSPVSAEDVNRLLGNRLNYIIDGGECEVGIESTIIDLSGKVPTILREGAITKEQIEELLQVKVEVAGKDTAVKAPGMMFKHYSPNCPVRMTCDNPKPGEALLAFGTENIPEGFSTIMNLSPARDLQQAAANLFKFMHKLETMGVSGIAVMPIPEMSVGIAINERLRKASGV